MCTVTKVANELLMVFVITFILTRKLPLVLVLKFPLSVLPGMFFLALYYLE